MFRVRNFLEAKRKKLNLPIKLLATCGQKITKIIDVKFPDHINKLYDRMHSKQIDSYVEEKKKIDLSDTDTFSVSSVDDENSVDDFALDSLDEFNN
jgi:hypothetical protein